MLVLIFHNPALAVMGFTNHSSEPTSLVLELDMNFRNIMLSTKHGTPSTPVVIFASIISSYLAICCYGAIHTFSLATIQVKSLRWILPG